jgi:release factor glutamine methyltransferase
MTQSETWTILKVLNWSKDSLFSKGIENARLEAEWLLCAATGLDRVGLYLNFERPLTDDERASYRIMVTRRGKREPLQHILGSQEFCGMDFEVTPDVLIPRHDTETLVYEALKQMPGAATVLDIGTGSGCIAVSMAKQLPMAAVTAVDISEAALAVARRNAERNGVAIEFLQGSLCEPVAGRCFDMIVSNPPYIRSCDILELQPEVREFDPRCALDGGDDGLDIYNILIPSAYSCMSSGGWLLVEIGAGQASDVVQLFQSFPGYGKAMTVLDSGGIERVVGAQRKDIP